MQGRTRIFILILLIVVIVAVVAVVMLGNTEENGGNGTGSTQVAAQNSPLPTTTDLPTPTPTEALPEIVIAVQSIPRGAVIRPEALALREWPPDAVPFNAILDPTDVIGMHARTDIYIEQPILTSMAVPDLFDLAEVGSDVASIIPPGRVAVAVPMDRLTSVAYGIQPGDHVDIIVSMLYVDIDNEYQSILPNEAVILNPDITEDGLSLNPQSPVAGRFESERVPVPFLNQLASTTGQISFSTVPIDWPVMVTPREEPRPRLVTQRTVQDAMVLWVGDFPLDGRIFVEVTETPTPFPTEEGAEPPIVEEGGEAPPAVVVVPPPDIFTLAITPQQAVILTNMIEAHIPLTFSLRGAADTSQPITEQVTLDFIMNEYNMSVPIKQDFAIEPAIRSIRQTFVGSEISLGEGGGTGAVIGSTTAGSDTSGGAGE